MKCMSVLSHFLIHFFLQRPKQKQSSPYVLWLIKLVNAKSARQTGYSAPRHCVTQITPAMVFCTFAQTRTRWWATHSQNSTLQSGFPCWADWWSTKSWSCLSAVRCTGPPRCNPPATARPPDSSRIRDLLQSWQLWPFLCQSHILMLYLHHQD